ncbi:DUF4998 domain-containing protein [Sphingobacterium pedocola]|uniref:DUF5013 domain-containing protein n=1 Tax=Sphingobacterium pedocola TaxID=2082722 RepID=A0ABR9T9K7_9SPHI|nr:DUF4998 domain-containing protein [Sphingobacterium pedocola]MBE8721993.1 hypothetical protein [Sphingobacterium pedocola]
MERKILLLAILVVIFLSGCRKMDSTYEQYVERGGRIYTAKPSNVTVQGGLNRIKISWPRGVDPNIVKARISWNTNADFADIAIVPSLDTISHTIDNLTEDNYSFVIVTYDQDGNSSVPLEIFGNTYGNRYQARLLDRPILTAAQMRNGTMFIAWGQADTVSGAFASEIKYVNLLGDTVLKRTDFLLDTTIFQDYKKETSIFYRTLFLPTANALDTFYTSFVEQAVAEFVPPKKVDLSSRYLKNFKIPFQRSSYDGARWGTLSDWTTNAAVRNQGPAGNKIYGGYDNINNSASFGFQKWGNGDPTIVNGKVYQTVILPAGDYEVIWTTEGNSGAANRGTGERYLVAAAGNVLPDVANLNSALGHISFVTGVDRFNVKIEFTLEEETEVSIGILINFTTGQQAVRAGALYLWGPEPI